MQAGTATVHTYTITVTNGGPSDALSVNIADTWPAGFTPTGAPSPSQGSCVGSPSFTCNLGTIPAGGTATVTVSYTVPSSTPTGTQTNTVTVSSPTDSTAGNNTASDTTNVSPALQAVNDSAMVNANSTNYVIDVLANDTLPPGGTISSVQKTGVLPVPGTTTATTDQGGTVTIVPCSTCSNANGTQAVSYTPATDYVGPDGFDYTITDGTARTGPLTSRSTSSPPGRSTRR